MNRLVVFVCFFCVVFFCSTGLCLAGDNQILLSEPSPRENNWLAKDALVTNPTINEVKPSMTSAPNGDLFVAVEDLDSQFIRLYRSTDGGLTWVWVIGFATHDDSRNPSIAYGQHTNGEKWVYVAYEGVKTADDTRKVMVFRYDLIGGTYDWSTIAGPFIMNGTGDQVHPQIITDFVDWADIYYVYLTYAVFAIDYYPVFSSRSTDRGSGWSTPLNVTGGSENTGWPARPEIAYGRPSGLFIAFVKPGWNGASWSRQIWVTKSVTFGASFTTPVQLTTLTQSVFHPSVAVAHGVNSVVVAYTFDFVSDMDVVFTSSTDGGTTWDVVVRPLPWTIDHESSVDLTVSNSGGNFHAAYKHEATAGGSDEIWYTSASTAAPTVWSSAQQINKGETASAVYPRPTITVIPGKPSGAEAAIAWADWRQPYPPYDVYFESPIFADGFESGNTSAWSSTVP